MALSNQPVSSTQINLGTTTPGNSGGRIPLTAPLGDATGSLTGTPAPNAPAAGASSTQIPGIVVTPETDSTTTPSASTPQTSPAKPATPTPQVNNNKPSQSSAPASAPTAPTTTTTNSADIQALVEKFLSYNVSPNPLDNQWQVAYHWQLFTLGDNDIASKSGASNANGLYSYINNTSQSGKIVVAESGVTTYNIKSVEMKCLVGPNYEGRNINATNFTITIIEPLSVGFLDALKQAALQQGVRNLQYSPYYLGLSFKAYNETTGAYETDALVDNPYWKGGSGPYGVTQWMWAIHINDIDTHFDEKGGQYVLSCQAYNDYISDRDYLNAPQAITASGGTLDAFFSSLGTNLTNAWRARNGIQTITYAFKVHDIVNPPPSVTNAKVGSYSTKLQSPNNSSVKGTTFTDGTSGAIFAPGTLISDMIDWPLINNEQINNLGLDRDSTKTQTDQSQTSTNDRKYKESIIFRVETDVQITGYDYVNALYVRTVTFHIWPFYTQAIIASPVQRDNARDPKVQGQMVTQLMSRGLLVKNYDYLFTGLNTEVINMDIKSNFKWAALLPKLVGARMVGDNYETTPKTSDEQVNPQANAKEVPVLAQQVSNLQSQAIAVQSQVNATLQQLSASGQAIPQNVTEAQAVLQNPNASSSARTAAQNTLNTFSSGLGDLVAQQTALSASASTLGSRLSQLQDATIPHTQTSTGQTIYAEDLIVSNTGNELNTQMDYENFNFSIPFRQGYKDLQQQVGTGLIGPYHRDRSTFGSLIEQLYEPYTVQLSNVDLEIRGDPYWLGQSNLQRVIDLRAGNSSAGSQTYLPNLPNWYAGDQVFLFSFRYPIIIGNDFKPVFRNDDTFMAFYRATEITSYFSDGVFKQRLHGIIYPLVNPINALSNVSNTTAAPTSQKGNTSKPTTAPRGTGATSGGPINRQSITTPQQQANAQAFKAAIIASAQAQGLNLTPAQVDGIVANAYRESGMNPAVNIIDSNGKPAGGLLQWNGPQYTNFAAVEGVTPNNATIQQQADYLVRTLNGTAGSGYNETNAYAQLSQTTTGQQATSSFLQYYERGRQQDFQSNLSKSLNAFPNMYGPGNPGGP